MKNVKNIRTLEQDLTVDEVERIYGILMGLVYFKRVNKSDMNLIAKLIYQGMDKKEYKLMGEHDAMSYLRKHLLDSIETFKIEE